MTVCLQLWWLTIEIGTGVSIEQDYPPSENMSGPVSNMLENSPPTASFEDKRPIQHTSRSAGKKKET